MRSRAESGVTLIEMIVVVALIGLMAAIAFPAVASGLDSIRLNSASDSIVSFLNAALDRAERRQEGVEMTISITEDTIVMRTVDPGFVRTAGLPQDVDIVAIHPALPNGYEETARTFYLYPGGSIPRIGIEIANKRGMRRIVRVDPITGVPQVETPQQ
jgi:prepilin-type N-terminal cleavage/methylation domain-containing protein